MPIIPVTDWVPDAAPLGNPGSVQITNAIPGRNSYKPMPSFSALTDALGARARGAIDVRDRTGNVYQFAGDVDTLYELSGTSWSDVSLGGGYSTGTEESWEFVKWKDQVLATNFTDEIQTITLGGSNFADLTSDFRCRHIAVIQNHVVVGNTNDATDGDRPDRIRWSAFEDETDWTVSPVTGADFRDLKGEAVQKIFGGEYGVIFSNQSTYRMDYIGAPQWFQIVETLPGVGLVGPGAAARIGDHTFAWTTQGFVAIQDGTGFAPIGAGRVDEWAFKDLDDSYLTRLSCVADPRSGRVFWAYPGSGNTDGRPNKILCYDKHLDKWSLIEQELELLWAAGGVSTTLEQLDSINSNLDLLPVSLDSSQWKGDAVLILAAFDSTFTHGFFQGMPMEATIDTRETELNAGYRTMLSSFRPLVDGGSVTAQVCSRNDQSSDVSYGSVLNPTSTGRFTTRSNARYHRLRLIVSGEWEDAVGVQVEPRDALKAGMRG